MDSKTPKRTHTEDTDETPSKRVSQDVAQKPSFTTLRKGKRNHDDSDDDDDVQHVPKYITQEVDEEEEEYLQHLDEYHALEAAEEAAEEAENDEILRQINEAEAEEDEEDADFHCIDPHWTKHFGRHLIDLTSNFTYILRCTYEDEMKFEIYQTIKAEEQARRDANKPSEIQFMKFNTLIPPNLSYLQISLLANAMFKEAVGSPEGSNVLPLVHLPDCTDANAYADITQGMKSLFENGFLSKQTIANLITIMTSNVSEIPKLSEEEIDQILKKIAI